MVCPITYKGDHNKEIIHSILRPRCKSPPSPSPQFCAVKCIVNEEENPLPAIGDAPCRQFAEGGPSHGHRQHAQKFGKDRAWGSGDILSDRQTGSHKDRRTHHITTTTGWQEQKGKSAVLAIQKQTNNEKC